MTDRPLPLTVIAGYLGAGKTTLVNRLLSENHGRRYAVIVNEFGEIGIDGMLFEATDDDVFEMSNGCVCCTVQGDLSVALSRILEMGTEFDGIILETSGLAQPAPIVQALMMDGALQGKISISGVVTVIDVPTVASGQVFEPAQREQLAFADIVVVTKADTAASALDKDFEFPLRAVNDHAPIVYSGAPAFDIGAIVALAAFDPARRLAQPGRREHAHDHTVSSVSLRVRAPIASGPFMDWISALVADPETGPLRVKGVIRMSGDERPFVVQGVRNVLDGGFRPVGRTADLGDDESCLVVIGRSLDPMKLQADFSACMAGAA